MGCRDRTVIVTIAVYTFLQGALFTVMSILAILAHNCDIDMNTDRLSYLMYVIYFRNKDCGPVDWSFFSDEALPVEPIMPDVTLVAFRTNIIAIVYLVLSLMWIVTSVNLLIAAFMYCIGRTGFRLMYIPWILTTCLILILDLVAGGFFAHDLTQSFYLERFLWLLEVENTDVIIQSGVDFNESALTLPAIIMLCVSLRGALLWILNVSCFIIVIKAGKRLMSQIPKIKMQPKPHASSTPYTNQPARGAAQTQNVAPAFMVAEQNHNMTSNERYNDPGPRNIFENQAYENDTFEQRTQYNPTAPQQNQIAFAASNLRPVNEPHKDGHRVSNARSIDSIGNQSRDSTYGSRSLSSSTMLDNDRSGARSQASSIDRIEEDERPRSTDYWSTMSNESRNSVEQQQQQQPFEEVKPKPIMKHSYTSGKPAIEEDRRSSNNDRLSTSNPPEELRSQLPWSYFQARDDVSGPKKKLTRTQEENEEDLPPVPVPDYTMHFPKKNRSSITVMSNSPTDEAHGRVPSSSSKQRYNEYN